MPQLSELKDRAAALLPTEAFVAVSELSTCVSDFIESLEQGAQNAELKTALGAKAAQFGLIARQALGIDELSEETLRLFANKSALSDLSKLDFKKLLDE